MSTTALPNGTHSAGDDPLPAARLQTFLAAHPSVQFLRLQVVDYGNTHRTRLVPRSRALQLAAQPGAGVATGSPIASAALPTGDLLIELIRCGKDVWVPDWATLRPCPWEPSHASVLCDLDETSEGGEGDRRARCPRTALRRAVAAAKEGGVEVLVGFEIEFVLLASLKADSLMGDAVGDGAWVTAACHAPWWSVVDECVAALEAAGVPVWGFHCEGAASAFEIATAPKPALEAADALVYARDAIKAVAAKRGYHATMHPMPFEKGPTCASHVHLSLSKPEAGEAWLAGWMKSLRGLSAFMLAGLDSYGHRESMCGGGAVCWGWENKANAVKRIEDAYWELRVPDALGNVHLMLAALIGVGMDGVSSGEKLLVKSNQEKDFIKGISEEKCKELGITSYLPKSLAEAVTALKEDETIAKVLGMETYERYIYFKEKELEAWPKFTTKERWEKLVAVM